MNNKALNSQKYGCTYILPWLEPETSKIELCKWFIIYTTLARLYFLLDDYIFSWPDTWESDTVISDTFLPHRGRHPSCLPNTRSLLPPHLIVSQFCSGWQCAQIKIQFPRLLCSERWLCDIILSNELEADLDGTFSAKLVFFWTEKTEPTRLFPFAVPPLFLPRSWVGAPTWGLSNI